MEITANAEQEVLNERSVIFTNTPIPNNQKCIKHDDDSALIYLRGLTKNQCKARFLVEFSGNIALPTTGTAPDEISLSLALADEAIPHTMTVATPTTTESYFNVSTMTYIDIPAGFTTTLTVKNTSGVTITVRNATLIVTRVA